MIVLRCNDAQIFVIILEEPGLKSLEKFCPASRRLICCSALVGNLGFLWCRP
jgi:hypothetical protein